MCIDTMPCAVNDHLMKPPTKVEGKRGILK